MLWVAFLNMNAISTRGELFLLKSNKIISGKVPFLTKNLQKYIALFIDLLVNTKGTAALLTSSERTYFFRRIRTYRLRIRLRIPKKKKKRIPICPRSLPPCLCNYDVYVYDSSFVQVGKPPCKAALPGPPYSLLFQSSRSFSWTSSQVPSFILATLSLRIEKKTKGIIPIIIFCPV